MTAPGRSDASQVVFLLIGIVLITVGMTLGLAKIGDALVSNNPDAGNLYNPASVAPTAAEAGAIIGSFVAIGSAFLALAIRRLK